MRATWQKEGDKISCKLALIMEPHQSLHLRCSCKAGLLEFSGELDVKSAKTMQCLSELAVVVLALLEAHVKRKVLSHVPLSGVPLRAVGRGTDSIPSEATQVRAQASYPPGRRHVQVVKQTGPALALKQIF